MSDLAVSEPVKAPCERCGQVHVAGCRGHVEECTGCESAEGCFEGKPCPECGGVVAARPCRNHPMHGQQVCKSHGGRSPQNLRAAARRLEERRVNAELAQLLTEVGEEAAERGPQAILLEQLWRAAAMARLLELRVGELGEDHLVTENHLGDDVESPLAGMLRQWTVESARLAKLALDAGFEERRIELVEGQAEIVAGVLRAVGAGVLEALGGLGAGAEVRAGLEAALPGVMRGALELARGGAIDVEATETKET